MDELSVKYQKIWSNLYLLLGFLFALIFLFAGYYLNDYSILINLIGAIIIIYIGIGMRKHPYIVYATDKIEVYNFMGTIRKKYNIELESDLKVNCDKLYLNGQRVRINAWMIDKRDWVNFLAFFNPDQDELLHELQD